MTHSEEEKVASHIVVINLEAQYSLWQRKWGPIPRGWRETGVTGEREDCLAYIQHVWTDMRPLSLRKQSNR